MLKKEIITTTDWSWGCCKLSSEGGGGPGGGGPTYCKATDELCKKHEGEHNVGDCICPLDEGETVVFEYSKEVLSEKEIARRERMKKQ